MKRLLAYILLVTSFLVLVAGSSPILMNAINKWIPSPYTYGDLYMFSNLRQFKNDDVLKTCGAFESPHPKMNNVNVFVLGDSYAASIESPNFNVNKYHFIHWENNVYHFSLDEQKKNILLIESAERYFRERMQHPINCDDKQPDAVRLQEDETPAFNMKAEDNLTYLLTYNKVASFFKETKALINLHLFNRIDKNVNLSKDKNHIFYIETVDSISDKSSFSTLPDAEVNTIIENLNSSYHHLQSLGFSAVYLTLIPNAASLVQPANGNYNQLIPRIESSPRLEIPVIDLYDLFKQSPDKFYFNSDTHWNCEGKNIWLQKIDSVFYSISKK